MKKKLPWKQLGCLFLLVLVGLLIASPWLYDWSRIKVTRSTLPSGDTLIEYLTPGSMGLFEPGAPTIELYIQWQDTGARERFYDGYANFYIEGEINSWHDTEAHIYIVQTSDPFFWRPEGASETWRTWRLATAQRQPLYDFIKNYVSQHAATEFKEEAREVGYRLNNVHQWVFIGDEQERTWNLPYVITNRDFKANVLTVRLKSSVPGLPPVLIFSGPSGYQGGWEFDLAKSTAANQ